MNAKPTLQHFDTLVRHTLATLPDSIRERKTILVTLHSVMPAGYPHEDDLVKLIETLHQHEAHQLKFEALLDSIAVNRSYDA